MPRLNKTLTAVLGISVGLHVLALVAFGSFTIWKAVMEPEPEFSAPPAPEVAVPPEKVQYKVQIKELQKQSQRVPPQRITVKNLSNLNTPSLDINPNIAPGVSVNIAGSGTGLGFGSAADARQFSGFIDGLAVSAGQLGVVLDASGSMAGLLPDLIPEIQKQFPNAMIVRITHASFGGEYNKRGRIGEDHPAGMIAKLERSLDSKVLERFMDLVDDTYFQDGVGGGIRFLVEQGCDTIYVYTDFGEQDRGEADLHVDDIVKEITKSGYTIYINAYKANAKKLSTPGMEAMVRLAYDSGGAFLRNGNKVSVDEFLDFVKGGDKKKK